MLPMAIFPLLRNHPRVRREANWNEYVFYIQLVVSDCANYRLLPIPYKENNRLSERFFQEKLRYFIEQATWFDRFILCHIDFHLLSSPYFSTKTQNREMNIGVNAFLRTERTNWNSIRLRFDSSILARNWHSLEKTSKCFKANT